MKLTISFQSRLPYFFQALRAKASLKEEFLFHIYTSFFLYTRPSRLQPTAPVTWSVALIAGLLSTACKKTKKLAGAGNLQFEDPN